MQLSSPAERLVDQELVQLKNDQTNKDYEVFKMGDG